MKKILMLIVIDVYLLGCSSVSQLLKNDSKKVEPIIVGDQDIVLNDSFEKAVAEGKILEGMTSTMVEKSWGKPDNKLSNIQGFVIWTYNKCELYFWEDVLISLNEAY